MMINLFDEHWINSKGRLSW